MKLTSKFTSIFLAAALGLIALLSLISYLTPNFNDKAILKPTVQNWAVNTSCTDDFSLPSSPTWRPAKPFPLYYDRLFKGGVIKIGSREMREYTHPRGPSLILVAPKVNHYPLKARNFADYEAAKARHKINYSQIANAEAGREIDRRHSEPPYIYNRAEKSYSLNPANITLIIASDMILPQWISSPPPAADQQLKGQTDYCQIAYHEQGHIQITWDFWLKNIDSYLSLKAPTPEKLMKGAERHDAYLAHELSQKQDRYHDTLRSSKGKALRALPYNPENFK